MFSRQKVFTTASCKLKSMVCLVTDQYESSRGLNILLKVRGFNMKVTFKQLASLIYNLLGLSSWVLANLFMGYTGFVFIELGDTLSRIMGVCMLIAVSASFVALILYTFYLTTKKGSA
jgi:hypothetical protein